MNKSVTSNNTLRCFSISVNMKVFFVQWGIFMAILHEGGICQPNGKSFIALSFQVSFKEQVFHYTF